MNTNNTTPAKHPILFSTAMVQAILAGRKTETRRICKHQFWSFSELIDVNKNGMTQRVDRNVSCPYGQPGDVLWVRETFCKLDPDHIITVPYVYKADSDSKPCSEEVRKQYIELGRPYQWKPSIHMPKAAARIWLQVTEIKVEHLQDITEQGAIAEGVEFIRGNGGLGYKSYLNEGQLTNLATLSFQTLWQSINGPDSWAANPWVWVVKFKVLSTTGKPQNL